LKLSRAIILTHDVDWPIQGPGVEHVLARKDRFASEIIAKVEREGFNPYFGVPKMMEIEEKYGVRSTFFFRPSYDDGSKVDNYSKIMQSLLSGGWEVGLHCNGTGSLQQVATEKEAVEIPAGQAVLGSRVHYLKVAEGTFENLSAAGIKYDSSLSFSKEQIDKRNTGVLVKNGLIVFPVTFMDAYLFSYMHQSEETVVPFILDSIEDLFASSVELVTLLWHDNSVFMKGGRAYEELIRKLTDLPDITFLKGIEAYELIKNQRAQKVQ
jgi:peptidoglycan/xylan/chitin deacetylase (PgdA/CDA1 family)